MEVIIGADAALERAGRDLWMPDAASVRREALGVSLRSCRITCGTSRLGGNVRSQVLFESDHSLRSVYIYPSIATVRKLYLPSVKKLCHPYNDC